jgi:quinol monooxygenase YgiN
VIVLTAYALLKPEKIGEAKAASNMNKARALQTSGCLRCDYFFSAEEPNKLAFVEEWATKDDLDRSLAQQGFADFMAALSGCLESPPEIRVFDAALLA